MKYPVFIPDFGEAEIQSTVEVMRRGEISGVFGRAVPDFEERFSSYLGAGHGIAVSNGTTALQLAARVAGVGPGDEVIVSASTNIAAGLAVHHNGAKTIPWDSENETWNADLDLLEGLITEKTKAIIQVHLFGNPMNMERLMEIAGRHNIVVIEDCAEAHGAEWNGRKVGSFGDMACFSFLSNKTITTGEGGMVVTSSDHHAEQLRYLRNLAFGPKRFLHEDAGYNFRLSSIQAGFGLAQLDRLEEVLAQKIDLYERYAERLKSNPAIQLPVLPEVGRHGQWMVAIRIDQSVCPIKNQDVMMKLREAGIDSRSFFCPMNQQPFLDVDPAYLECPVADAMWEDGLYLPSTTSLTNDDLDEICGELNSILSS